MNHPGWISTGCLSFALLLSLTACPPPVDPKLEAEAHYHKATEHRRNGDLEAAVLELREALKGDPTQVRAHHALGDAWLGLGRATEAEAAYEEAIELEPGKAASWVGLGNARRQQRRLTEAAEAYTKAIALDPADPAPHRFLGDLHAMSLEVDAAVKAYREAARLAKAGEGVDPLEQLARLFESKGRYADAAEAYSAAVDAAAADDEQRIRQLAVLEGQGRREEARQLAREVAEAATVRSIRLTRLGDLRAMAGMLDGAMEAYRAAITLTPDHAPLWELVAAIQVARDDLAAARASYARARELDPTSASAVVGLAELELQAGRITEAKKALQTTVATLTGDEDEVLLGRVAAVFSGTGDHEKAAVMYENLLATVKEDPALWVALAGEQRALGEPEAAAVSCARAQKLASERDPKVLGACAAATTP